MNEALSYVFAEGKVECRRPLSRGLRARRWELRLVWGWWRHASYRGPRPGVLHKLSIPSRRCTRGMAVHSKAHFQLSHFDHCHVLRKSLYNACGLTPNTNVERSSAPKASPSLALGQQNSTAFLATAHSPPTTSKAVSSHTPGMSKTRRSGATSMVLGTYDKHYYYGSLWSLKRHGICRTIASSSVVDNLQE
ncbi:hypothetical protein BV22DRAFT_763923 [Leucogyrophana mollusca]|uniref:Uncharacterized protein n=1 Tax=Leucogyrophana mollusca TaxID=85980 RepID=A0ACB8B7T6_9AGAM|nr:hypothetical protein BV22DRAFT_763923 [Leucogyrophana mollusca]